MKFLYNTSALKKINRTLWLLGLFKIRMIGFVNPKVVEFNEEHLVLKIRLNRRTKNHLNSMYLGALVVGADLAAGLPIAFLARENNIKISLAFKNMSSEYMKRPDSDVFFVVEDPSRFERMLIKSQTDKIRITEDIPVKMWTHYNSESAELIAESVMGLSIRVLD